MKTLLLTGAFIIGTAFGIAQPGPGQSAGPGQGMRSRIMDQLNLTDQQKKEVDKIHSEAMKAGIDRRAEIARARVDLRQLYAADKLDQSAIQKKVDEIAGLRSAGARHRIDTWFAINKLLTPEQQKVWKQGLERRAEMGGRMMRGMRGNRPGRDGMRGNFDGPRGFRDRGPR